ncbi:hypothetical protein PRUB_a3674 [Pseudoalteromonas rubra]|uniref:Uncharacterized protein n=1 Tax=Pseudoalteromonas rubra TaxID=43658 RepID=A0A8T0C861_9GAMM|nr:hypothetical protein PRUB_a3674 [Pseudoalteromonas rubra]
MYKSVNQWFFLFSQYCTLRDHFNGLAEHSYLLGNYVA